MKTIVLFSLSILCAIAAAAQEVAPPAFNGMSIRFLSARLAGKAIDAAAETGIPFDSLSPRVAVAFRVDTAGVVSDWHYMDNTRTGRDSCSLEPATPATRRLVEMTYARLEGTWTPAVRNGRKIGYIVGMYVDIPVEEIGRRQGVEPLRFLGEDPEKSFYDWAHERIRYDERHAVRRSQGIYRIRFFVEADGTVTIDDALDWNDEKLLREVIRVIRNSKGKWTPRKVHGAPQRSEFVFSMNFL